LHIQDVLFFEIEGGMKKFGLRIVLAVILMMGALAFVNSRFTPGQEGEKFVQLIFIVETDGVSETVMEFESKTDLLTLGELLDEVLIGNDIAFVTSGSKSDPFGRFVLQIGDYETKDMSTGPWWMYDSTTNEDCLSAGYCAGIDLTPLYDQDIFIFTFSSSY
jgi:hypothetical protein